MKRFIKTFSIVLMVLFLFGCAKQEIHMDITNTEVTIEITDAMNSSLMTEEDIAEKKKEYEALGYKVKDYSGEDGMVGVVYYKTFKLSDVSSEEPVKYHLEEGLRDNFKNPKIFKVEEGLFGNTYTADLVLDTSVFLDLDEGETVEEYEEEIEEYANYVDIYYKVTLPKKAVSHNADLVDGKTYTWNVEYGSSKDINYVFKTTSPWVYAIIIIVAIAIIAVAVLAIMKFIKNKKSNIQIPIQPATEPLAVDSANESNPGYMMPIAVEPKIERMVSEEETVVPEEKIAVEDENIAQQETIESEAMVETENPEEQDKQ